MRENLAVFVIAVGIILGAAIVTHVSLKNAEQPPMETRVRLLLCDPEFYQGRKVKIPTEGMERIDDKLVYRIQADKPPVVICNITPSDQLPTYVIGICDRRPDGVMMLNNCNFSDR